MTQDLKAIPTTYSGIEFRSRLEARWAAFLDNVKADWDYEPQDFDGYIPDFRIHAPNGRVTYLEIKPGLTRADLEPAVHKAASVGLYGPDLLLVVGERPYLPALDGASGLYLETWDDDTEPGSVCEGIIGYCYVCKRFGWCSTTQGFDTRPCGCYDGCWPNTDGIEAAWRAAHTPTKWKGTK